ncbi:serine/threonine-protein kinase [Rubripirellula reticaptiva]|uniref:Serine/threonine-protein kinase PrkC n=1 Tax=Rubripirellula reticaptiva TaxID=2528013 RepID=A0A5C6FE73_9BACT|nr:serine/threonine-protein kinase [Rubripirellula reticaptiva]TWU57929.1 Serine/threonine-protein kinase PrkC [Rubripirellula reticaptiva]
MNQSPDHTLSSSDASKAIDPPSHPKGWKDLFFAPRRDAALACDYAAKASLVADRWNLSSDSYSRKKRVMSRLFDKLRIGSSKESEFGTATAMATPIAVILDPDSSSDGLELENASDSAWLAETHVSEPHFSPHSTSSPMKFTYSPGSSPLPRTTIRRGIGMGGFGEVYFAVTDAGKEVALKRIQRNLEIELRGVSHCLNLKHPNLVALYDVCPDDQNQWWVVMEYVAGPNLREVLDDSPEGLSKPEVDRWFTGIAAGVHHLHSAGLVHRDLKPGNVFDDMGIVKVGDYGLSKFISTSHRGGHTESVGTFHYMAPEIGRGQYGREIDIYAMGIVLYELLTGQVPFDGESCQEIIVKHMTSLPDVSDIAEPYRSTIATCLEKDPAKRFHTIPEMLESLGLAHATATHQTAVPVQATMVSTDKVVDETDDDAPVMATVVEPSTSAEPFARALQLSLHDLNLWWRTLDRSPVSKAVLMLVAGFVLLINTHWLLPLLSVIAVFYVPYYIVRQMVLHVHQQPSFAQAQRLATTNGAAARPMTRSQWREHMRSGLRAKHSVHRVAELNTSWIAAILTVIGLSVTAGVVGLHSGPVTAMNIAPYGWMAMVVMMSSMGILGMGKLWEREDGEGLPRRLVLAGIGLGVGTVAFAMQEFLKLPVDHGLLRDIDASALPQALYTPDGVPMASAMMAHFALLFAALRWWKPVDPLRRTRLSPWAVAVAVVVEWGVHQVLPIPQPTGMLIAGGIAITVQMAAPWVSQRKGDSILAATQSLPNQTPSPTTRSRSMA